MIISVIIVSWNVRELLKRCLESIFKYVEGVEYEAIVIDNASNDETVEMARQEFPQVKLIINQNNRGFAAANNQGIRQAKGRYILLLNPDTEFIEDTLTKVATKMESDPSIGVLGCQLLNPDGSIQHSVRRFPTVWSQLVILTKLHKIFPSLLNNYLAEDFDYEPRLNPLLGKERGLDAVEVDQVMGAFFCVRREVFDKIGLLDEGYFIWFEEVDFCRRAKKAGYKVVYWPGTRVIHHGAQSFKQQMTIKKQWWFFKSALRYFSKSHGFVK